MPQPIEPSSMGDARYKQEIYKSKKHIDIMTKIKTTLIVATLFVSLIVLLNLASAYSTINIYIDQSGEAVFVGTTTDNISQSGLPQGIEVNESKISGITDTLTSKQGETWTFSYSLSRSTLNIVLPKNIIIDDVSNGQIQVLDNDVLISAQNSIKVDYRFTSPEQSQTGNNTSIFVLLIVAVIVLVFLILFFNKRMQKKESNKKLIQVKKPDRLNIIEKVLNDREKLILANLKESGKIKMSYLRKLCDIPKASFSRHLQELERKGLIKRSGEGKNKIISLSK